jgi:1-acyl-sn-glycerol-3-phosphate acyltransferase
MKYLISVWEWIFGVSMLIIFLILFLIAASIFPYRIYIKWVRWYLSLFFKLLFIKVKVEGLENIDRSMNYVFMSNHISMFDIPLLLGFIPLDFWGIQTSSHFKVPLYGWVLKKYGNLPIDRSNARASLKTMMEAVEHIKNGKNIMVLPEGTRSMQKEMGEFKKLPFLMAKKSGTAILPIAFIGLWEVNNKTSFLVKPGTVRMVFGKPIEASIVNSMNEEQLRQHTRERIEELMAN